MPRPLRFVFVTLLVLACVGAAGVALAQTPPPGPLPGETPDTVRGIPWFISFPIVAAALGLVLLLVFSYWRLSGRFYATEEQPKPRTRYAGMAVARSQAAAPQGAATAQTGATAASRASGETAAPPRQAETPPEPKAAPADEAKPEPDKPAAEGSAPEPREPPEVQAGQEGGKTEPDQETFDRVLQEQLDKGVSRRVAEGRARAAALKATRGS